MRLPVISVVPAKYKEPVNLIAELFGCGENNLSRVAIRRTDGEEFWFCHSWWLTEDLQMFMNEQQNPQATPTELHEALPFIKHFVGSPTTPSFTLLEEMCEELGLDVVQETSLQSS